MKFKRYTQNLSYEHPYIISYTTKVAKVCGDYVKELGYWSVTTRKHVNYAANELNKDLIYYNQEGGE